MQGAVLRHVGEMGARIDANGGGDQGGGKDRQDVKVFHSARSIMPKRSCTASLSPFSRSRLDLAKGDGNFSDPGGVRRADGNLAREAVGQADGGVL